AGVDIDALEDLVGVVLPGHGAVHRPLPAAGGRGHGGRRFGRWRGRHRPRSRGGGNGGRVGGRRRRGGPGGGGGGGFDTDGFDLKGFGGDFPCRDRHGAGTTGKAVLQRRHIGRHIRQAQTLARLQPVGGLQVVEGRQLLVVDLVTPGNGVQGIPRGD